MTLNPLDEELDHHSELVKEELQDERQFEELSLSELMGAFIRSPLATVRAFFEVTSSGGRVSAAPVQTAVAATQEGRFSRPWSLHMAGSRREQMRLGLYFSSYSLAVWGTLTLVSAEHRYEEKQLHEGTPLLLLGFVIWVFAEAYADWPTLRSLWRRIRGRAEESSAEKEVHNSESARPEARRSTINSIHPVRVLAGFTAFGCALMAWFGTADNTFRAFGFYGWVVSIIAVVIAVAPESWWSVRNWLPDIRQFQTIRVRFTWTTVVMILIFLLAAYFRLNKLDSVPPEMTSDHIEKVLDSWRVYNGVRDVFFINNGGREPFQFYAIALFAQLPGLGFNFWTIKLLAVIEGLITIPVLYWMGREIIGKDHELLGKLVGLSLAAMVAVSYWHVTITRQALRIVLMPLVSAIVLIYLARAMRWNKRGDYIKTGLALGFGLYTYQAARMLPVGVIAGVGLAVIYYARSWFELRKYVLNFTVLVLVSFVVFVPLFRFSVDYPEEFWRRTFGRLLGDDIIQVEDEAGNLVWREASIDERLDAFQSNIPILTSNIRNALLMYNWKGDIGWINGYPNYPSMDSLTGAFLIVGLAAWFAMTIRRRDPVFALMPLMVVIMLLPSALSIAAPIENPSATRTSGSIPPVYIIAALPLALMMLYIPRVIAGRLGLVMAAGLFVVITGAAYTVNSHTYLVNYLESYDISWRSQSAPGHVLRGFATSDGAYGNAFIVHSEHFLDHRIVGLEGGVIDWGNAVINVDLVPDFINDQYLCTDRTYRVDPDKDLLFFYAPDNAEAELQLFEWFPDGKARLYEAEDVNDEFKTYRVPALGFVGLQAWLEENRYSPSCF